MATVLNNNKQKNLITTSDKLKSLRLHGMSERYEEQKNNPDFISSSFDDRFQDLIDHERLSKDTRKVTNLTRQANLSDPSARIEDLLYIKERNLNKEVILNLANGDYITAKQNIIMTGASGSGKTFLANALGVAAIKQLCPVLYIRCPNLIELIADSKAKGIYYKYINKFRNIPLLIIDEWLLYNLSDEDSKYIFEALHDRYNRNSTILASQYNVNVWYERMGKTPLAESILDRFVHNSVRIKLQNDTSMRQLLSKKNARSK